MHPDDKRVIEVQFAQLYEKDPVLKQVLNSDPKELSLYQKYQVMI